MNENKKGYWIYSIVAIIIGMSLFAFLGYLIYDLILKLADKDFSNNTVIQALITLIITVFIGGYFEEFPHCFRRSVMALFLLCEIKLYANDVSCKCWRSKRGRKRLLVS